MTEGATGCGGAAQAAREIKSAPTRRRLRSIAGGQVASGLDQVNALGDGDREFEYVHNQSRVRKRAGNDIIVDGG